MFNLGFSELVLILLVAFIVVGPKDLPKIARALGRGVRSLQRLFDDFKEEVGLDEAMEEFKSAEKDFKKTVDSVDPTKELRDTSRELTKNIKDIEKAVKPKPKKKSD